MRVQVDRRKGLNSQDLFPFGGSKMKKILRALIRVTDKFRTVFYGSPKEFILGPKHYKLFKIKQVPKISNNQNKCNKICIHSAHQFNSIEFSITLQGSYTKNLRHLLKLTATNFQ